MKGTTALEYLITYGIAIIIISVTLTALWLLGVFGGTSSLGNLCIASSGFSCMTPVLYSSGKLTVSINTDGNPITINQVACTRNSTTPQTMSAEVVGLTPASSTNVTFYCPLGASNTIGSSFSGYLWINYSSGSQSGIFQQLGSVNAKVSGLGAAYTTSTFYLFDTLNNTQSVATPAPFDQLISFDPLSYSQYEANNLGNIRFYSGSGELYSWCESGCTSSSTSAVFWINLPSGIQANGKAVVTVAFTPSNTNYDDAYAGEAPQLMVPYGLYDEGANVFTTYQNFKGTSCPSGWTCHGVTISNGVTITNSGNYVEDGTPPTATGYAFDYYDKWNSISASDTGIGPTTNNGLQAGFDDCQCGPTGDDPGGFEAYHSSGGANPYFFGVINTIVAHTTGSWGIESALFTPSNGIIMQLNYGTRVYFSGLRTTPYPVVELGEPGDSISIQWVRVRPSPPNGVMPGVTTSTRAPAPVYVNITVSNGQGKATPASFQQLISFNPSNYKVYESAGLGNIRFYEGSTKLYGLVRIRMQLNGEQCGILGRIAKRHRCIQQRHSRICPSSQTQQSTDDVYAGEAPQLSSTYAQFDNGNKIFTWYQRWGGLSSMPSGWSGSLTSNTFNANNAIFTTTGDGSDYSKRAGRPHQLPNGLRLLWLSERCYTDRGRRWLIYHFYRMQRRLEQLGA